MKTQRGKQTYKNTSFSPEKQRRISELGNKKNRTKAENDELKGLSKERKQVGKKMKRQMEIGVVGNQDQ